MKRTGKQRVSVHDVKVIYPARFSDVQYTIDALMGSVPLIVSFKKLDDKNTQRFLDFLSGAIYAIRGGVLQLGERDFLFSPEGSEVVF